MRIFKFYITILIFTFYILNLYAMDVNLWNIPVPQGTQIVWQDKPFEISGRKGNATHLRIAKKSEEIIDFYKDILKKEDWQILQYYKEQNIIAFKKGDQFMYVVVGINGKDTPCDVYLASSQQDLAVCMELKDYFLKDNLAPDVPGNDFVDVLRYPGARRRMNVFMPQDAGLLMYETDAKPDEVASFYNKALKSNGWDLSPAFRPEFLKKRGMGSEDFRVLFFQKDKDSVFINITPFVYGENSKRTLITISKNISQELSSPIKPAYRQVREVR